MSDYKNIIFDVGDVLVSFRYRDYMIDLGFEEDVVEFLTDNMIFTDFWEGMDLGVKDLDDACAYFTDKFPDLKEQIEIFWNNIEDIVGEYDYSNSLINALKDKGYKVYLLSNYPDKLADMHWSQFSFLNDVDGYVISAKVKLAKPDPAIYNLLLDRYGLRADESVFIDDRQVNIDAAEDLGIKGILFTGYDDLKNELKKL